MNDQIFPVKKCNGVMGVPITFFDKYDPSEWEILGMCRPSLNGQKKYARILIRRRQNVTDAAVKENVKMNNNDLSQVCRDSVTYPDGTKQEKYVRIFVQRMRYGITVKEFTDWLAEELNGTRTEESTSAEIREILSHENDKDLTDDDRREIAVKAGKLMTYIEFRQLIDGIVEDCTGKCGPDTQQEG